MKNNIVKVALNTAIVAAFLAAMTQTASASVRVPDAASTSMLMAVACAGLTAVRRFLR